MQLSEAIKQFQVILKEHGDIELEIAYPCYEENPDICTDTSNELEIKVVVYGECGKRCVVEDIG